MRTTLDIDDALLARAKAEAAKLRTTLTRLVEEGLALRLAPPGPAPADESPELPVFRGGSGLAPGIDPLSNQTRFEAVEANDVSGGRLQRRNG